MAAVAKRIVLGYDGTADANRALDLAAELAGYGATVTVVNVAKPLAAAPGTLIGTAPVEESKRIIEEARRRLGARGITARSVARVGEPASELIEAARELEADLLVVGNGKRALERVLLGSVSTHAVHNAPCDVLVVRGAESERLAA